MKQYELPFCQLKLLRDDIVEVIINEGVEMDLDMVMEYHEFLLAHLKAPFSVLVNKLNSYTYTFDAQMKIGTLNNIKALAFVSYTNITDVSTKNLASLPRPKEWNFKMFKCFIFKIST